MYLILLLACGINTEAKTASLEQHVVFAACATSVKLFKSDNDFRKAIPFKVHPSKGTFSLSQSDVSMKVPKEQSKEKNKILSMVVENKNLKANKARKAVALPMCRELHPKDPTLCLDTKVLEHLPPLERFNSRSKFRRIIYELHVPTFSPDGTFDGCIPRLNYLVHLGITTVQLMPVTIDYDSSWGYSTAHLFAIRSNLGGYSGLKRFVKAAHSQGLEVFMDVVYNHASAKTHLFGIDRCEFDRESKTHLQPTFCPSNGFKKKIPCAFGSYFYMDENQLTPWGPRYNFSSEQVRDFLMSNVKYWVEELGIDGLRFDSTICIR